MNLNAGSNKTQWSAMDLHIGSGARFQQVSQQQQTGARNSSGAPPGAGGASAMRLDDSGLSARNILIRRKLMERKRFDSADYAMKQNQEEGATTEAMSDTSDPASSHNRAAGDEQARYVVSQQKYYSSTQVSSRTMHSSATPFSPAQVGASVLFSALGGNESDENANMDTKMNPSVANAGHNDPSTSKSYAAQNISPSATVAAAARSASRYGNLPGPAGGAQSARNILIQKKLREKKHFDSADYQLAQIKTPPSSTDGNPSIDGEESNTATPMEIDPTPVVEPVVESINSPSAANIAHRSRVNAQMSPSVRGGKYGGGLSGANVLLMRKLSAKKQFDSADYYMEAAPVAAKASQSFFVTAPAPAPPTNSSSINAVAAPPAPQAAVSSSSGGNVGSKYGKLSAVNVLIRKKLKERKRFDSADYAMEKQGRRQPPNGDQGGSSGTLQGGHVVMGTPMTHNVNMNTSSGSNATTTEDNKSISHQVKHIKLSEEVGGWATRVPASSGSASSSSSSASFSLAMLKHGSSNSSSTMPSGDSRLVARNLIIQRKLSERKRFDSADYYKEAANRGQS